MLLKRQSEVRFGGATADRLAPLLARMTDPEALAEVGEWLLVCGTGEEFDRPGGSGRPRSTPLRALIPPSAFAGGRGISGVRRGPR